MRQYWNAFVRFARTHWIVLSAAGVVLIAGIVIIVLFTDHRDVNVTCTGPNCPGTEVSPTPAQSPTPSPTPKLLPALLDGALVVPGSDALRPLGVMIENHPDARPQSGLQSAGLVYEAIAEGGITRFLAFYSDPRAAVKVGPVRSARLYFVQLANELQAFYAHAGGNNHALDLIKTSGTFDIDGLYFGPPTFVRDTTRNVASEHTLYSSTDKLWSYAVEQRKWPTNADFGGWLFTDDAGQGNRGSSQVVDVNFSTPEFAVSWTYQPSSNTYLRSLAGKAHIDANTGSQLYAKNLVTQTVTRSVLDTKNGTTIWQFDLNSGGKATVYQNGKAVAATWKKDGNGRTRYYDATSGKEIEFVRGLTWIMLTHPDTPISVR